MVLHNTMPETERQEKLSHLRKYLADRYPVRHEGEYVLTREGKKDFGEITPEMANKINNISGGIRLRKGTQINGEKGNYGESHINRADRLMQLNKNGYENARDFVEDATQDFNAIYPYKEGGYLLHKKHEKKGPAVIIDVESSTDGDFYDTKTGMLARNKYFKNKKPLWEKPQSGSTPGLEPVRSARQPLSEAPRGFSVPDTNNIPQSLEEIKRNIAKANIEAANNNFL